MSIKFSVVILGSDSGHLWVGYESQSWRQKLTFNVPTIIPNVQRVYTCVLNMNGIQVMTFLEYAR